MTHLRIRNWERFQHYRDRNPLWVKLYRDLLDDAELMRLPDASKWLAVGLLLVAARHDNVFPNDPKWVGRKLYMDADADLESLLSVGFVETCDASTAQAPRKRRAMPKRRENREQKEQEQTLSAPDGAAGVTSSPKPRAARPKSEAKYPHYPPEARQALHAMWQERVGACEFPKFVKLTAPLFASADGPLADVPLLVRAIQCAKVVEDTRGATRFLTPASFAQNVHEYLRYARMDGTDLSLALGELERRHGPRRGVA